MKQLFKNLHSTTAAVLQAVRSGSYAVTRRKTNMQLLMQFLVLLVFLCQLLLSL